MIRFAAAVLFSVVVTACAAPTSPPAPAAFLDDHHLLLPTTLSTTQVHDLLAVWTDDTQPSHRRHRALAALGAHLPDALVVDVLPVLQDAAERPSAHQALAQRTWQTQLRRQQKRQAAKPDVSHVQLGEAPKPSAAVAPVSTTPR